MTLRHCLSIAVIALSVLASNANAQYMGGDIASRCLTIKHLKLESYWEESRAVLINTCNQPIWVAFCNAGASQKQFGCGTGSKYYRQQRIMKANEKYDNYLALLKNYSQEWAECPATDDGKGGFAVLNSDGSYQCKRTSHLTAAATEQHFSCGNLPGGGTPNSPVIVKEARPGILFIEGPGSTVNLNLSSYFSKTGEAKTLTSEQFKSMQSSLVNGIAQACSGKKVEGDADSFLNWFGNCEKDDLDCMNRTFSGKSRITGWGVRG